MTTPQKEIHIYGNFLIRYNYLTASVTLQMNMLSYKHEQQYSFSTAETISRLINDSTDRNHIGNYFVNCW